MAAGALTVTEGKDTADDLGVWALGTGNVLLYSTGAAVALQGKIDGGAGHVTILAATFITQDGIADIVTTGAGTIDVEAGTFLTMADGAMARTANRDIRYQARNGDVTVETLNAGHAFVKIFASGSILDQDAIIGPTDLNVIAFGLYLEAGVGAGTLANPLEVTVSTLALSGGRGGAFLTETDDLVVAQVGISVQRVGNDATVTTRSGSWGDLNTTGSGSIVVVAGGSMTLTESTDTTDDRAVHAQGGGSVRLVAGTWFQQQAHIVTEGGSVETEALGGTNVMLPGIATRSAGGDIHYRAKNELYVSVLDASQTVGTWGNLQIVSTTNAIVRDSDNDRTINLYGNSLNFVGKGPEFDTQGYGGGRASYPAAFAQTLESVINALYLATDDALAQGWIRRFQHMPTTQGLLEHYGHLYLQVVDRNDILGLSAPALLNTANSLSTIVNLWWNGYHGMNAWYRAIDVEHYNFYTYSATFGASASFGRNEDPLSVNHMAIFGESTMLSTLLAQGDLTAGRGLGRGPAMV